MGSVAFVTQWFSKSRPNLLHDFPDLPYDLWPSNDTIVPVS